MLEKVIARTCFKLEWRRLGLWALFSIFVFTISFCTVLKPYTDPLSLFEVLPHSRFEPFLASICDFSGEKSDYCELNGDIRIQGNSSSIYFSSLQLSNKVLINNNTTRGINLYARKNDKHVMNKVKPLWLKPLLSNQNELIMPECTVNHSIPAIVFSTGGYAGNLFHDTSDVLIPLYLTSLQFHGQVQLLAQDRHSWWILRHQVMFDALSNYSIIDLNHDQEVRCFKSAIVGLKSHKDFGIDPTKFPLGFTLRNFTQFTRKIYGLEREIALVKENRKPKLLIISRKKTRAILNEDELVNEARKIGYDVKIIDARMNLKNFSKIVNSIDVMIGVHGAGLTNMVYLPENAVLIQVVPIGLESVSRIFYERPARDMNLKYMEYKVSENESTLLEQYPSNHQVIMDPNSIKKKGWLTFRGIYMDNQDVRLDLSRFRTILFKALERLRQ